MNATAFPASAATGAKSIATPPIRWSAARTFSVEKKRSATIPRKNGDTIAPMGPTA